MSENNQVVELTPKAIEHIKDIFSKENKGLDYGLRLGVVGGGCSGLNYSIDFGQQKDNDNISDYTEFRVFVDPKSSIYLKGVTLDYKDGLSGKGLVFINPNAKNTCGCGESFSV